MKNFIVYLSVLYFSIACSFTQKSLLHEALEGVIEPSGTKELIGVKLNGKWGYIDTTGKVMIPLKYDRVFAFEEGKAVIKLGDKYGVIDEMGNTVCPSKYTEATYGFQEGLLSVQTNGKWGCIDSTGKEVISFKYDSPPNFLGGLAATSINNQWGYIDTKGNTIIPFQYESASDFRGGMSKVKYQDHQHIINKKGRIIYQYKEDSEVSFLSENILRIRKSMNYGLLHQSGKIILAPEYTEIGAFSEGFAWVKKGIYPETFGFIDTLGNFITPIKYSRVHSFSEGFASVEFEGTWSYIDKTGKTVIAPNDAYMAFPFSEGFAFIGVRSHRGSKVIDKTGKVVFSLEEKSGHKFENGFAHLSTMDYKHPNVYEGIVNNKGKVICPTEYDMAGDFHHGLAIIEKKGKRGLINKHGKVAVPLKYERIYTYNHEFAFAQLQLNGKWGMVDNLGRIVVPFEYEQHSFFGKHIVLKKGNKLFLIKGLVSKK